METKNIENLFLGMAFLLVVGLLWTYQRSYEHAPTTYVDISLSQAYAGDESLAALFKNATTDAQRLQKAFQVDIQSNMPQPTTAYKLGLTYALLYAHSQQLIPADTREALEHRRIVRASALNFLWNVPADISDDELHHRIISVGDNDVALLLDVYVHALRHIVMEGGDA